MTQIEIDIEDLAKAKSKKRVWVKPTSQKKGYYREMEVGRKEGEVLDRRNDEVNSSEEAVPLLKKYYKEVIGIGTELREIEKDASAAIPIRPVDVEFDWDKKYGTFQDRIAIVKSMIPSYDPFIARYKVVGDKMTKLAMATPKALKKWVKNYDDKVFMNNTIHGHADGRLTDPYKHNQNLCVRIVKKLEEEAYSTPQEKAARNKRELDESMALRDAEEREIQRYYESPSYDPNISESEENINIREAKNRGAQKYYESKK